jgi:hypothetical protein
MFDVAPVAIGGPSRVASRVRLTTALHPIDPESGESAGSRRTRPVWLSAGVIVRPSVTICDHTLVGARQLPGQAKRTVPRPTPAPNVRPDSTAHRDDRSAHDASRQGDDVGTQPRVLTTALDRGESCLGQIRGVAADGPARVWMQALTSAVLEGPGVRIGCRPAALARRSRGLSDRSALSAYAQGLTCEPDSEMGSEARRLPA